MVQSVAAYVGGQNVNVPRVGKLNCVGHSHCDAVGFLAGSASGAPDAERTRAFPELFHVQVWQDLLLQRFKKRRIAKEGGLLRQESLKQRIIFNVGILDQADQVSTVRQLPGLNVFNHASREEAFARIVKMDSRTRLNQAAYLAQFVFANGHYACHVSLTPGPNGLTT